MKVKNRIKHSNDFLDIMHSPTRIKSGIYSIYFKKNDLGYSRIGISTSKKLGNAVVRNRIKRQIRSIIHSDFDLSSPLDIIIVVKDGFKTDDFQTSKAALNDALEKIRRTLNE